jgi:Spy/CpxP family protein refolding chaperone
MKRHFLIIGLIALAACGQASDYSTPVPMATAPMLQAPPIYALLGQREKLELTSAQVTALDSLGTWIATVNSPLTMQLREMRGEIRPRPVTGAEPQEVAEVEPIVERIRANNRQAMEGVKAVLTPEQQTKTCELFHNQRNDARDPRGARSPRANQRRPGMARDSVMTGRSRTWEWCDTRSTTESR